MLPIEVFILRIVDLHDHGFNFLARQRLSGRRSARRRRCSFRGWSAWRCGARSAAMFENCRYDIAEDTHFVPPELIWLLLPRPRITALNIVPFRPCGQGR